MRVEYYGDIKYTLGDVEPPAEERVNAAKEILGKAL